MYVETLQAFLYDYMYGKSGSLGEFHACTGRTSGNKTQLKAEEERETLQFRHEVKRVSVCVCVCVCVCV